MFSKLVFDLNKVILNFKDSFFTSMTQDVNEKDVKEISLLFEIL